MKHLILFGIMAMAIFSVSCTDMDVSSDELCKPPSGSYLVEFIKKSGSCDEMPRMIVNFDDNQVVDGCISNVAMKSKEQCTAHVNSACLLRSNKIAKFSFWIKHNEADGTHFCLNDTINFSDLNDRSVCSGVYSITYQNK